MKRAPKNTIEGQLNTEQLINALFDDIEPKESASKDPLSNAAPKPESKAADLESEKKQAETPGDIASTRRFSPSDNASVSMTRELPNDLAEKAQEQNAQRSFEASSLSGSKAKPRRTGSSSGRAPSKKPSRKQKRQMADTKISAVMALVFFAFALLIAVLMLILPRPTVSEIERRPLSTFPSFTFEDYFSGKFTSGITQFYDDTVPGRDSFKNVGNNIKTMFGLQTSDSVEIIGNVARVDTNTEPETPVKTEDPKVTPETDPKVKDEPKDTSIEDKINSKDYRGANADATMEDGILVVHQDGHYRALVLYGGVYDTLYSDTVNYVRQVLSPDVNVYFMPVPLAAQFYLPANYEGYSADQESVYQLASSYMTDGIKSVDIIGALNDHNEEEIYLRTDHHWAPLGAYYAAKEFANAAGVPFAELDTYTKYVNEGYVGTMYAYTGSANLLNDPEEFIYYVPSNSYTVDYYDRSFNYMYSAGLFFDTLISDSYSTFLGGDDLIAKITTDVKNGRRLLVVKDSYGNAEVPFYTNSFEEIYVIDNRYFEVNLVNFIAYNAITDVLFTHNYMALAGPEAELLEYMTYYNSEVPIYDDAPAAVLPDRSNVTGGETIINITAEQAAEESYYSADTEDYEEEVYDDTYEEAWYDDGTGYEEGYYEEDYYSDDTGYDEGYYEDTDYQGEW